jgi:hypothetical protein
MEIFLVIVVLAVIAAAAFMWMRSRNAGPGLARRGEGLRGPRGTRVAARHDPMAEVVERHAMATDPHEAAEAELRLQAQANRVAADLHAQQASALESEAGGVGGLRGRGSAMPADAYGQPVYQDGQPLDENGRPAVYEDGTPVTGDDGAAYYDEQGRPVYPEDRPRY